MSEGAGGGGGERQGADAHSVLSGAKFYKCSTAQNIVLGFLQAVVDKEVSQLLSKQEAQEQLASLQQRREVLQAERDDKQQQRSQLELQLMRFAQKPRSSVLAESQPSSTYQAAAQQGDEGSHQGQGSSEISPGGRLASHGRQSSSSPEQLNGEEEEIRRRATALDDAEDTCQAQMQYLDSSMTECKAVSTSSPELKHTLNAGSVSTVMQVVLNNRVLDIVVCQHVYVHLHRQVG